MPRLGRVPFFKSVGVLAGGAAAGQLIAILVSPLLTRLYTPDQFGVLAVFAAVLGILATVASLRFDQAVPLPESEEDARTLVLLALVVTLAVSALVLLVAALAPPLERFGWYATLRPYLPLLAFGTALAGTYQALNMWAVRTMSFTAIGRTRIAQGLSQALGQTLLGLAGAGTVGLLIGQIGGQAAGSLSLARLTGLARGYRLPSWRSLTRVAERYWQFAAIGTPAALLNSASLQVPPLLLVGAFGAEVAGLYLLSNRVLSAPLDLVSRSVGQVYYAEASRIGKRDPAAIKRALLTTTRRLLLLGLLPAAAIALVSPWAFSLVFGASWAQAGAFAQAMALMTLARFVVVPTSQTFLLLERQSYSLALNALKLAIALTALSLPPALGAGPLVTVAAYSGAMSVYYALVLVVSLWVLSRFKAERQVGEDDAQLP